MIKRAWLISDLHFGIRNNNKEWIDIQFNYFYNFFIPYIKKYKNTDDNLFILGDIFDNKHLLNVNVFNKSIKLFDDLSKMFNKIYVIAGIMMFLI